MTEVDRLVELNKMIRNFFSYDLRLCDILKSVHSKHAGSSILLFVDQFEEVYTLCENAEERALFIENLLRVTAEHPDYIDVLDQLCHFALCCKKNMPSGFLIHI